MIRVSRWIRALAPVPCLALVALVAGFRPAAALAREFPSVAAGVSAMPVGPVDTSDVLQVRGSTTYGSRKLSDARLARTRRCQGSGSHGRIAPSVESLACLTTPESPLQLEPSAACIQDRLDVCTRSPRPPPQV